ncbi:unnamed protein product [Gordionus sp. m RMFG-2023]
MYQEIHKIDVKMNTKTEMIIRRVVVILDKIGLIDNRFIFSNFINMIEFINTCEKVEGTVISIYNRAVMNTHADIYVILIKLFLEKIFSYEEEHGIEHSRK